MDRQDRFNQNLKVHSKDSKYDAFISYRREGGSETSRSIKESLEKRGVSVFLDFDELKTGRFDEKLLMEISEIPNFLLILSEGALDRCSDPNDWVAQEIAQALKFKKNIILILKKGFDFSKIPELPDSLKDLTKYNGISYDDNYYNAFVEELCNRIGKGKKDLSQNLGSSRQDRQKAYDIAILGKQLLKQGNYDEAYKHFAEARALDVDSSLVYLGLGLVGLFKAEDPKDILAQFQRSMSLDPGSSLLKYAYSEVAYFLGYSKIGIETLKSALSIDPTNEEYRILLESWSKNISNEGSTIISNLDDKKEEAAALAEKILDSEMDKLPEIKWWITSFPPWSIVNKFPFLGSLGFSLLFLLIVLISNIGELTRLTVLQYINITILCFLGLWAPILFSGFLTDLYEKLKPVVAIPQSTFKRWFLSECVPFSGYIQMENEQKLSFVSRFRADRFNFLMFFVSFLLFFPFQTACALGFEPFKPDIAHITRFVLYYLEIYLLSWIPPFVIGALGFIPGFVRLPIRYFVGMPDSISLKPLGTFYLKIAALGAIAFTLFTCQHYLFRTHVAVPIASVGFIVFVYTLFFAIMFFTQTLIMMSLDKHRKRIITEYSYYVEEAYKSFIEEPTPDNFSHMRNHRDQMRYLKNELSVAGLTRSGYLWFICLSLFEILLIILYFYLVMNKIWI
jgi:tetratricopeptide (TPR) repeat protein